MEGIITIYLAEDHSIVRDGIKSLFNDVPDMFVIGEAGNGAEALQNILDKNPDILLTDITMPKLSGIKLTELISKNKLKTKVVVLSMHDEDEYIINAFKAGAYGYFLKDVEKEDLISSIRKIHNSEGKFGSTKAKMILHKYQNTKGKFDFPDNHEVVVEETSTILDTLTKRERQILNLVISANSNKEIAQILNISSRTVDTHRANIMNKLGVKNTAELVRLAVEKSK
jgi:DNA-binding NarL/FixJ family response regulator